MSNPEKAFVTTGPQGEPLFCATAEEASRLTSLRRERVTGTLRGAQGEIIIRPGAKPAPLVDFTRPLSETR